VQAPHKLQFNSAAIGVSTHSMTNNGNQIWYCVPSCANCEPELATNNTGAHWSCQVPPHVATECSRSPVSHMPSHVCQRSCHPESILLPPIKYVRGLKGAAFDMSSAICPTKQSQSACRGSV
jgi:hypothetical protein